MGSRPARRPRVALATRIYSPEPAAAAFRLSATVDALADAGIGVEVYTTTSPTEGAGKRRPRPGVRVLRRPVLRNSEGAVRGYAEYLSFDLPVVARLLAAPRPDVIMAEPPPTTGLAALAVARLRRTKFVYFLPDVWSDGAVGIGAPPWVIAALRTAERILLRHADAVLATSEDLARVAGDLGVRPETLHVVGNGADDQVFTPEGPAVEVEGPTFVHAGRLSEWQGLDVLVEAFPEVLAHYPAAKLVFLGQGSQERQLKELAERTCPGAVVFAGQVPGAEAAEWLRSATAAIACHHPDSGYSYARTTKVYAAAACGTPVIYVGAGPMSQEVPAQHLGWAAEYAPAAAAGAMIMAIENPMRPNRRKRIAAWALENASLSAVGRRAVEAIAPLVGSPLPPPARPATPTPPTP